MTDERGVYPRIRSFYSDKLAELIDSLLQIESALRPDAEIVSECIERMGKANMLALSLKKSAHFQMDQSLSHEIPIPDDLFELNDLLPRSRYGDHYDARYSAKLPNMKRGRNNTDDQFDDDGIRVHRSYESNSNVGNPGVLSSNRIMSGAKRTNSHTNSGRIKSALPKSSSKNLISKTPPVIEDPNEATGNSESPLADPEGLVHGEKGDAVIPGRQYPPKVGSRLQSGVTNRIPSSKIGSVSGAPYDDTFTSELLSLKKQIVRESQLSRLEARAFSLQPKDTKEEIRKKRAFGLGPRALEERQDANTLVELAHKKIEMYKLLMNAPNAEIADVLASGGAYRLPSALLPQIAKTKTQRSSDQNQKARTLLRGSPLILLKDRPSRMKVSAETYSKQQKNYHEYQRDLKQGVYSRPAPQRSISVGAQRPDWWG